MKSKLPYLHIIILFLLLVGIGVLFYLTEKKIVEVNQLQIEVGRQSSNTSRLADLKEILPTLSEETKVYLRTLPSDEADVANVASTMEQIARSLGLIISFHFDDFTKQVDVSGQNIYGLGSEIVLEGSFQGLTVFLSRLSGLPYFFKIDKLTIVKHESKPGMKAVLNGFLMMNLEKK